MKELKRLGAVVLCTALFMACSDDEEQVPLEKKDTLFSLLSPEESGIDFVNAVDTYILFRYFHYLV